MPTFYCARTSRGMTVPALRAKLRKLKTGVYGPASPAPPRKVGFDLRDHIRVVCNDPAVFVHGNILEFSSYALHTKQPAQVGFGYGFDLCALVLAKRDKRLACNLALLDQAGLFFVILTATSRREVTGTSVHFSEKLGSKSHQKK